MFGNFKGNPNTPYGLMALGQGLAQLGAGQPVNMSGPMEAIADRQQKAQMREAIESSGVMERFGPDERALIAKMPANLAMQVIMGRAFREPEAPKVTDDMAEYNAAKAQGYMGTLQDWILDQRKAGATTVNNNIGPSGVDYGTAPAGMAWRRNADGTVMVGPDGIPQAGYVKNSPQDRDAISGTVKMAGDAISRAEGDQDTADAAQRAIDLARDIRDDPALPSITGTVQGRIPAGIPFLSGGQDGADLYAKVEQLQGKTFLEAYEMLKGGGPITDLEGKKAQDAMARLQTAQSDVAYKEALNDFIDAVESGMKKLGVTASPDYDKTDEDLFNEYGLN